MSPSARIKRSRNTKTKSSKRSAQKSKTKAKRAQVLSKPHSASKSAVVPTGPYHVLMRVRSADGLTVRAHRDVIARQGTAMLGKLGKALGSKFIAELNVQITNGVPTYLFLTTREGWNGPYVTYQCRLTRVESTLPESKVDLVPSYYSYDRSSIGTWFEITTVYKMSRQEMNQITVVSSGREIMSVIASSASTFRVRLPAEASTAGIAQVSA